MAKMILKAVLIVLAAVFLIGAAGVIYLTVREYKPKKNEEVEVPEGGGELTVSDPLTFLTWNTGYAGLDKTQDFFMDGGTKVMPDTKEEVLENMEAISRTLKENPADIYFLQEVDLYSKRSYYQDQTAYYSEKLGMGNMFAYNFKCDFVPYPLPFIGHVESGVATYTGLGAAQAKRIALPESFSWPVKTCNLKRCLLTTRIPIKDSDKELVLVNLHLEAYDDGEGKKAQSALLAQVLEEEYQKGNYVIAGGDFNQTFSSVTKYPIWNKEGWVPPEMDEDSLPQGFRFVIDDSYPTCRLLNAAYTGAYDTSQVYVLDGFIVSENVNVETVDVLNVDFAHTDHQPVRMTVRLK